MAPSLAAAPSSFVSPFPHIPHDAASNKRQRSNLRVSMEAEKENALSSDLQGSCDDNDILGNDNNDNSLAADAHFESLMLHSNSNSISNMQLHHQASPGAHFHQSQPHSHVNFYDHLDISTLSESESMAIVKYSTGMVVDLADSYLPSPVLSVPAASPTVPMDMTLPMTEMPSYYSPYSSDALSALQTQSQSGLYVNTGFPINTLPTIRPLNAYEKEQYQLYALHQQEHYDQSQLGHQQHHQLDHSPSMLASSLDMTYSYGDVQSPTMPMSLPIAISSSRSSHIGPMPRKKSTGSKLRGPLAHKRADMPLKLFKCTFNDHSDDSTCEKIFKRMEHLKRHMRVHTGERPFSCPVSGCVKNFSRSDNLQQHIKIHINKQIIPTQPVDNQVLKFL